MFLSESCHKLDSKNRVLIPKRIQAHLGRTGDGDTVAILTRGLDGCLFLFSEEGFGQAVNRLDTAVFSGVQQRALQRLFFSSTHRIILDSGGRIVIPPKLREQAAIQERVVLVGVAEKAEIWAEERWRAFEEEHGGDFDQLDVVLAGHRASTGDGEESREE